ncbi:hypothetical protein HNQ07_001514 [Deinococcus metalli]|uniref:Uncharacterized protein n=1 Tax=Deinococcus metalli TaxID=1141878 RepID=A0A7W8NRE4_9DEIO|nr:hypothetical protein [Deinococcus metalli]MBB5376057.1 hypothetical protein [Deinococcus metalli]GHF41132.1 hypothetical protein GCM10017781_17260 [Deinococcus metalli]
MPLSFPLTLDFRFSLLTELRVHDAHDTLVAVVKEKTFSVRDEVRVYADEARRTQTHTMKARGLLAGALDWKAQRFITRADGAAVGSLRAQGLRTLWGAAYDLLGPADEVRFTVRDDHPWLGVIEGLLDVIPFVGDFIAMGFDYLVNPTYTVTDGAGQPAYRVHKKRSVFSRRFTIEELSPRQDADDELVLLGLIQLVLRERERG